MKNRHPCAGEGCPRSAYGHRVLCDRCQKAKNAEVTEKIRRKYKLHKVL